MRGYRGWDELAACKTLASISERSRRVFIAADSLSDASATNQAQNLPGQRGVAIREREGPVIFRCYGRAPWEIVRGNSNERPNLHPRGARHEVGVRQVQVERLGRRVGDVRRERLGLGHALLRRHAADAPQHRRVRAL